MPRNPIGAFFLYPLGVVAVATGAVVMGFVAMTVADAERSREWLIDVLPLVPLRFTAPIASLASDMTHKTPALLLQAFVGALALATGLATLRSGRTALRPANQSEDGKFELALDQEPPRVGRALAGRLLILADSQPDQTFGIDLFCSREYTENDRNRREVAYSRHLEVQPRLDARGWALPFSFDIPSKAPASQGFTNLERGVFHWHMTVSRTDKMFASASTFTLRLAEDPDNPPPPEPALENVIAAAVTSVRTMDPMMRKAVLGIVGVVILFFTGMYTLMYVLNRFVAR